MTGDTHYDLEILAELAEGLLDAATALQVREHLAICDPCGESLADLAAVREVLAATPTPAMPMGVALRIDRALAAEAESFRGGGVGLVQAPAWDDIMRDAPWETTSLPEPEPVLPQPEPELVPQLGVVGDDGAVRPARRRRATQRRRWALPAVAAGAAAAVVGAAVMTSGVLTAAAPQGHPTPSSSVIALPPSSPRSDGYQLTDSNWNYTEQELRGSLLDYIGPAQIVAQDQSEGSKLDQCVKRVSAKVGKAPFAVDQGFYNGQEANIMVFWNNRAKNTVSVHVMGPQCDNVRKPALAHWK
ncbi:zf-HC2 domain-containing protein [Streptosporangium sp. NPDC051023]|uniref:anti-sigma factor family protein n=1 Tax=Streptosporangium sp. NPDC051023 TaxID=3155410 RepID=UPI00344E99FE